MDYERMQREIMYENLRKGIFPPDRKRRLQDRVIHLIVGIGPAGDICFRDLKKILVDWCGYEEGEIGKNTRNVFYLKEDGNLGYRDIEELLLMAYNYVQESYMYGPHFVIHYISNCYESNDVVKLLETVNKISLSIERLFGDNAGKTQYAYLFLPDRIDRGVLDYLHEENVKGNLITAVHFAGGENIHTSRNVRFSICCQLTAEYIFHCMESHEACPPEGILLPGVKKYYTLKGTPGSYHYREISNVVLHEFFKKMNERKLMEPTPEIALDLLLKSIGLPTGSSRVKEDLFYDYFLRGLETIEQEEMVSKEERKKMIHGSDIRELVAYCEVYVNRNKHRMNKEAEQRIRNEEIRGRFTEQMVRMLREDVRCYYKGPHYVAELCDTEQGYMKEYLSCWMEKANKAYRRLGDEKQRIRKEYDEVLDRCQNNVFYMLMSGRQQIVEIMERACEVELRIYRLQWMEKLMRECILSLMHVINPELSKAGDVLLHQERHYQRKREDYPVVIGPEGKKLIGELFPDEKMNRIREILFEILLDKSSRGMDFETFLKREVLAGCPYEELEKIIDDGTENGYIIPPATRNRQIRTHEHRDMESVMREHYPY